MAVVDPSQFSYSGNFEEQTQEILQNVRLSRQEVENMQILINDITQVFHSNWPGMLESILKMIFFPLCFK